ncbi:uncharacterized protein LTR77_001962 [Saxophila tyrrhenica]|uniref:Uncharacterized protein n=1 Tax=Saxophila tyrrhenica TaxID=1690608 RepID=A0AAV9PM31_9PEZI|nr:hypothetical protein LTR77_001962 [Saxophila tyrrhenica]
MSNKTLFTGTQSEQNTKAADELLAITTSLQNMTLKEKDARLSGPIAPADATSLASINDLLQAESVDISKREEAIESQEQAVSERGKELDEREKELIKRELDFIEREEDPVNLSQEGCKDILLGLRAGVASFALDLLYMTEGDLPGYKETVAANVKEMRQYAAFKDVIDEAVEDREGGVNIAEVKSEAQKLKVRKLREDCRKCGGTKKVISYYKAKRLAPVSNSKALLAQRGVAQSGTETLRWGDGWRGGLETWWQGQCAGNDA